MLDNSILNLAEQKQDKPKTQATPLGVMPDDDFIISAVNVLDCIDASMERIDREELPRGHLGMSQIGKEDERTLWLQFRWSLPNDFAARTLRIFSLGNILEDEIIRLLSQITKEDAKAVGVDIWGDEAERKKPFLQVLEKDPSTGKQFNFKMLGGHFAGSMDGICQGLPESEQWHVLELKSANDSRFKLFVKDGVKKCAPEYFGQVQCYMAKSDLKRALFIIYNKDTSELYQEIIKFDPFAWNGLKDKAERILMATCAPESSYPNRNHFEIKNYKSEHYQAVYWGDQLPPRAHCRNCRHSRPSLEGLNADWLCMRHESKLPGIKDQFLGCSQHSWISDMVPLKFIEEHSIDVIEYETKKGNKVYNVPNDEAFRHESTYTSGEMIALFEAPDVDDLIESDAFIDLRGIMGSRLVSKYADK